MTIRAIQYQMTDTDNKKHNITIDLIRQSDIGENMARSIFLIDAITKGWTPKSHDVTRYEVK